ncbi:MAG: CHAT domain-containing protein, partial [Cyanobacteria bacterium J06635_10]
LDNEVINTFAALDDITKGWIISAAVAPNEVGNAGKVEITSNEGSITTGPIASVAYANDGNTGNAGDISLSAKQGSITSTAPLISATLSLEENVSNSGDITLEAKDDIEVGGINLSTLAEGIDLGDNVTNSLQALNDLAEGWIISAAIAIDGDIGNGNAGDSGAVNISSTEGSITTGPIASVVYANDGTAGEAGDINLTAKNDIAADILASVSYGDEDTQVASGKAGDITVTTESFFRAPQTLDNLLKLLDEQQFIDDNFKSELKDSLEDFKDSSISSYGRSGAGKITITHSGNGDVPFVVGDATENGTTGDIITGGFLDGLSTRIESTETIPGNLTKGKIEIITETDEIPEEIKRSVETTNQEEITTEEVLNNTTEQQEASALAEEIEEQSTQEFVDFSGKTNVEIKTVKDTQGLLSDITQKTGVKPAVVYTRFLPEKYIPGSSLVSQNKEDVLNIIIVTAEGKPIRKQIKGATRAKIKRVKKRFTRQISQRTNANNTKYLAPAKQLYEWLVKPYESEMEQLGVKNLMFINDEDLRDLPVAALHDGKQFIIEKYSVGLLPSLSLSDTRYVGVKNSKVLAMGSSTFTKDQEQNDLPAVPIEISSIAGELWSGKYVSGENFTLDNLKKERANTPYGIIHLATHANFPNRRDGGRKESYIQLYDSKLRLEDVRQLGWNNPPVELLVLSACRTAIGDPEAELGYAGLAIQTGVKSAVASLWKVSDSGTLGLMTEFYRQLNQAPIKAEALRQTQLAMLQGKVRIEGNQFINSNGNVNLSRGQADDLKKTITGKLSHPHYWASFTMIGSPW